MGARRDFLNQALLDQRRNVNRSTINKDGGNLQLLCTVRQCVNRRY